MKNNFDNLKKLGFSEEYLKILEEAPQLLEIENTEVDSTNCMVLPIDNTVTSLIIEEIDAPIQCYLYSTPNNEMPIIHYR